MPQHEMPFAGNDDCDAFYTLDEFTQGYVHAIFFTECHSDSPELQDATFADLAPETLAAIVEDCAAFQAARADLLARASQLGEAQACYDNERAGTDYWFTRNGHGAGFWDRGLGEVGAELTKAAKADGSRDIYRGDDGKVYLS